MSVAPTPAGDPVDPAAPNGRPAHPRRTLTAACIAHAIHDGFTDLIYVLLPVWQAQFALGYGALAVLRGLYVGTLAALQVPSGRLAAQHLDAGPSWLSARS